MGFQNDHTLAYVFTGVKVPCPFISLLYIVHSFCQNDECICGVTIFAEGYQKMSKSSRAVYRECKLLTFLFKNLLILYFRYCLDIIGTYSQTILTEE